MTELERALAALGREVDFPETPAVAEAVLARIAVQGAPDGRKQQSVAWPRRQSRRRVLAVALLVLAVAVGAVLAVPQARSAILDFFGLQGATVRRVETLPAVPPATSAALELGEPVQAAGAAFPDALVPAALGAPDAVFLSQAVPGGKLSLVYAPGPELPRSDYTGVGLLVTQVHGTLVPGYVDKMAAMETGIERLTIAGDPALWLEGAPHFVAFRSPDGTVVEDSGRLAGNTLLLERGDLLVRIEGEIPRERAVAIAESLEPAR